ncbi:MAG: hypothetical protein V4450_03465 [Bacteroidota bacterium]
MRKTILIVLVLITVYGQAQLSDGYKELRTFSQQKEIIPTDSSVYLPMYTVKGVHYLLPFYKAFYHEKELLKKDTISYYQNLSQALAFMGDQASIQELQKKYYEKLTDAAQTGAAEIVDSYKDAVYEDAHTYILNKAKKNRVVMINEAHDKPFHRAFTISLLEDLYKAGFRYLAMEMLSNKGSNAITRVNITAGHYVCEPVAGELIRKALELGYTLVPYEDNGQNHTVKQREYAQAQNLYDFIGKKDSTAKILVHAGYSHIDEGAVTDELIPMAAYFKTISGIDPLTIDQTHMTEGGNTSFEASVYSQWIRKHPLTNSSVILQDQKSIELCGTLMNDIYVIHPPTRYSNARPTWLAMNGWKKEISILPAYRTAFLVQAYYEKEYNATNPNQSIPADQTYLSAPNGLYYLYLRKGKYKIMFRDKQYEALGTKDIEVL